MSPVNNKRTHEDHEGQEAHRDGEILLLHVNDALQLSVDELRQVLLDDEQSVQVDGHVVEPPLAWRIKCYIVL